MASGTTPGDALRNSIDLASRVERLGYRRHWVAEHHNHPGIASTVPAVLIAHLAQATSTLRVGSGGVLLPNHSPLAVAEQFTMLEALHPARIDLGLGRAPGTDPATAALLRRAPGDGADDFPRDLAELRRLLGPGAPPIWLLGSSGYSAQLAGALGLPFAFAHHFSPANTEGALRLYRSAFGAAGRLRAPYVMVAVHVVCAETDADAQRVAGSARLAAARLRTGRPGPVPSVLEAAAHTSSPEEERILRGVPLVVGGPDTVAKQLAGFLGRTAADELIVLTTAHDHGDRVQSYGLLARAFGLRPGQGGEVP